MSVTVTLHVYSGRPDPTWELTPSQVRDLATRIRSLDKSTLSKPPGMFGDLGYRGFSIQAVREELLERDIYVHAGVVDSNRFELNRVGSAEVERWLLETGMPNLDESLTGYVVDELTRASLDSTVRDVTMLDVPVFDAGKWNNDPNIRTRNNCYNYANDKITGTFAQPGRGSGAVFSALDCSNVGAASNRDGQKPVGSASSTPSEGHFAALVIWPGQDYHWYRLDAGGMWSHKAGQTAARNTDNSGQLVTEPQTCNRGNYTTWCGYYHCVPTKVTIL